MDCLLWTWRLICSHIYTLPQDPSKMHISTKQCPVLMRSNLHELFPAPEVFNKGPLTMVTLTCRHTDNGTHVELGAKSVSSTRP